MTVSVSMDADQTDQAHIGGGHKVESDAIPEPSNDQTDARYSSRSHSGGSGATHTAASG